MLFRTADRLGEMFQQGKIARQVEQEAAQRRMGQFENEARQKAGLPLMMGPAGGSGYEPYVNGMGEGRVAGEGKQPLWKKALGMGGALLNSPLLFMAPMLIPQGGGESQGQSQGGALPAPYLDPTSKQMMLDNYQYNQQLELAQAAKGLMT